MKAIEELKGGTIGSYPMEFFSSFFFSLSLSGIPATAFQKGKISSKQRASPFQVLGGVIIQTDGRLDFLG